MTAPNSKNSRVPAAVFLAFGVIGLVWTHCYIVGSKESIDRIIMHPFVLSGLISSPLLICAGLAFLIDPRILRSFLGARGALPGHIRILGVLFALLWLGITVFLIVVVYGFRPWAAT